MYRTDHRQRRSDPIAPGQRFTRLTVVRFVERRTTGYYWLCACDCGAERLARASALRDGSSRSCGCLRSEEQSARQTIHGRHGTPTWVTWSAMRARCYSPLPEVTQYHGARGIRVCERWNDFAAFLADMGERPSLAHSIDRIDPDGDYEPGNCRWATHAQQANNKRNNVYVEHNGERRTVAEWSALLGVSSHRLAYRLRAGWDFSRAVSQPPAKVGRAVYGQRQGAL